METPKSYRGYNKDGESVSSCTAKDANTYINPSNVQAAIDNVESVASEQMKNISDALNGIIADAEQAVIVQGTKMTSTIEETCEALGTISGSIKDAISGAYDQAVAAHDELQKQLNSQAENACWTNGATSVRQA